MSDSKKQGKIVVNCLSKRGRWRGGCKHPYGKSEYAEGHFDAKQMQAIEADSQLQLLVLSADAPQTSSNVDVESLIDACAKLDAETPRNNELWAGDKPKVDALAEVAGIEVNAKTRDSAWAAYQEQQADEGEG